MEKHNGKSHCAMAKHNVEQQVTTCNDKLQLHNLPPEKVQIKCVLSFPHPGPKKTDGLKRWTVHSLKQLVQLVTILVHILFLPLSQEVNAAVFCRCVLHFKATVQAFISLKHSNPYLDLYSMFQIMCFYMIPCLITQHMS